MYTWDEIHKFEIHKFKIHKIEFHILIGLWNDNSKQESVDVHTSYEHCNSVILMSTPAYKTNAPDSIDFYDPSVLCQGALDIPMSHVGMMTYLDHSTRIMFIQSSCAI